MSNTNESATVHILQKNLELNKAYVIKVFYICELIYDMA